MNCSMGSCTGQLSFSNKMGDMWYECNSCNHMGIVPPQMRSSIKVISGYSVINDSKIDSASLFAYYKKMKGFKELSNER